MTQKNRQMKGNANYEQTNMQLFVSGRVSWVGVQLSISAIISGENLGILFIHINPIFLTQYQNTEHERNQITIIFLLNIKN